MARVENLKDFTPDQRRLAAEIASTRGRVDRSLSHLTCAAHATRSYHMSKMVQIRNVPDALHRRLKSRAALAGMSLSDYLLSEIRQVAERPTLDELRARLHSRTEVAPSVAPAEAVRAERDRA